MDLTKDNNHFYYGFYKGKVEDNKDSENRGRLQIRVLGVHSQNNYDSKSDGIPTANLPWAEQAAPIFGGFGPTNKQGITAIPEIGSWVWVFFDNGNHNKPVYFASVIGNDDLTGIDTTNPENISTIKSKTGHKIIINDKTGEEKIEIIDKKGSKIVFDSSSDNIKIQSVTGGTLESMILGDTLDTYLTSLKSWLDIHIHIDPVSGVTGIPNVISPTKPTIKSAKNKNN